MTASARAPRLTPISGVSGKSPACFLVDTGHVRLLLDLGYGPQPGLVPDVDGVGNVDALLLSHGHKDHAGSLSLLPRVGDPVIHATEIVGRHLPPGISSQPLPLAGVTEILGIRVQTGRSGHAPGGVWLHLSVGEGLLYTGDYCTESILYAYDPPPPANTVVLDASYGAAEASLAEGAAALAACVDTGSALLPVPADGRGPEIALSLARMGCRRLRADEAIRTRLQLLATAERASVGDGIAAELAALVPRIAPIEDLTGIVLATPADGTAGTVAQLLAQCERSPEPDIVFTGYLPPGTPAERLVASGRARYVRWNVHPRLSDNVALTRATRATTVVPAFCESPELPKLAAALAPARVSTATCIGL